MNTRFFTIGPSKLFQTVPGYIAEALKDDVLSMSHRGKDFHNLFQETTHALRKFLSIPETHHAFFISSATEGMERIVQNCVGKKSFHLVNGAFAKKFWQTALAYDKDALRHDISVATDLKPHIPDDVELIGVTQNETSTGMAIPTETSHALKKNNPHTLLAIDVVSTAPYAALDYSLVDCAFFSVQKGFGLPAGLGVLIVSKEAFEKAVVLAREKAPVGWYHSFMELERYAKQHETPATPNVLAIYLLKKVTADLDQTGIDVVRKGIEERAAMLSKFVEEHGDKLSFFQRDPLLQSKTTMVIEVAGGSLSLRENLRSKGFMVGSGYGENKEKHIRIANFPAHTKEDVAGLLQALEDSLA